MSLTTGGSQTFQVSATDADNNLTKWEWEVDKRFSPRHGHQEPEETFTATGSITKSFSHTFPDNGTYTVTVTFTDDEGESGTAEWRAEVEDPSNSAPSVSRVSPSSPSSPVSLDTGDRQTFRARASDPDDNLKRYEWFVNGRSEDSGVWQVFLPTGSVTKDFSHRFSTVGNYTVKATFTDTEGESDFTEWTVTVIDPNRAPSVSRVSPSSPVSLTTGGSQTFQVSATDADNNLTKWEWEVDKRFSPRHGHQEPEETFTATGSITKSFSHTFPDNGTYTVTVTFTDDEGESGTAEWRAEVEDPSNSAPSVSRVSPSSPSSPVSLDTGDRQTFRARASDPDDNLKRYEWFVNGRSEDSGVWQVFLPTGSVTKDFSHRFSTVGNYTVKATFTDTEGESDFTEWTVTVIDPNRAPSVSRVSPSSPVSLTTGGSQTFQVSATDADNNLTKWEWEVDKRFSPRHGHQEPEETFTATGSITKSFSHTFPDNGTYTVTVTFTDDEGASPARRSGERRSKTPLTAPHRSAEYHPRRPRRRCLWIPATARLSGQGPVTLTTTSRGTNGS